MDIQIETREQLNRMEAYLFCCERFAEEKKMDKHLAKQTFNTFYYNTFQRHYKPEMSWRTIYLKIMNDDMESD